MLKTALALVTQKCARLLTVAAKRSGPEPRMPLAESLIVFQITETRIIPACSRPRAVLSPTETVKQTPTELAAYSPATRAITRWAMPAPSMSDRAPSPTALEPRLGMAQLMEPAKSPNVTRISTERTIPASRTLNPVPLPTVWGHTHGMERPMARAWSVLAAPALPIRERLAHPPWLSIPVLLHVTQQESLFQDTV